MRFYKVEMRVTAYQKPGEGYPQIPVTVAEYVKEYPENQLILVGGTPRAMFLTLMDRLQTTSEMIAGKVADWWAQQ